jgi:hypothetical protein
LSYSHGGRKNCVERSYYLETCSAGGNWQRHISFGCNLEAIAEALQMLLANEEALQMLEANWEALQLLEANGEALQMLEAIQKC